MPQLIKGRRGTPGKPTDDPEDFRATLVEHLEELRNRVIRSLVVLVVGWVVGWYLEPWLYTAINNRIDPAIKAALPKGTQYLPVFHQTTEPFLLKLKLGFAIGLFLAFPIIVLQLWGFVAPGLKKVERKVIQSVAPASVLLFAMGASFCYAVLPNCFGWFASYAGDFPGTPIFQEAGSIVFFVLKLELSFGVGFQLPLVVFILGKIGLLSPETLIRNWRQSTVAIFAISAIVTPSNDPMTMLMMAVPLSLLFIISVYAVKFTSRKRKNSGNDPLNNLD